MTKLYYDDPLQAVYMAEEFGVKYCDDVRLDSNCRISDVTYIKCPPIAYIHPDSYHIFDPMEGDVMQWHRQCNLMLVEKAPKDTEENEVLKLSELHKTLPNGRIIQRQGKPFFWPKTES